MASRCAWEQFHQVLICTSWWWVRLPFTAANSRGEGRNHEGEKAGHAARLTASAVRVIGNVQAEGASAVTVARWRVGGSVQVVQGRDSRLDCNAVKGDVQHFGNRGRIAITANRIDGNLQCKGNRPAPTGRGNIVQGNKEDQCARL
jgi:hypothetical protein